MNLGPMAIFKMLVTGGAVALMIYLDAPSWAVVLSLLVSATGWFVIHAIEELHNALVRRGL
jgi:hypothetical protein